MSRGLDLSRPSVHLRSFVSLREPFVRTDPSRKAMVPQPSISHPATKLGCPILRVLCERGPRQLRWLCRNAGIETTRTTIPHHESGRP